MHVHRKRALLALGFEFDGERAEWLRWYGELRSSTEASMLGTGRGADFYLYNWLESSSCRWSNTARCAAQSMPCCSCCDQHECVIISAP